MFYLHAINSKICTSSVSGFDCVVCKIFIPKISKNYWKNEAEESRVTKAPYHQSISKFNLHILLSLDF